MSWASADDSSILCLIVGVASNADPYTLTTLTLTAETWGFDPSIELVVSELSRSGSRVELASFRTQMALKVKVPTRDVLVLEVTQRL